MPVRIRIRGLAHGGEGVGEQDDGLTWFVPGALPGEVVQAEAEQHKARWARGRLVAVDQASPDRVAPPCPLADRCGGCDWQHVAPPRQGEHKRMIVADQLRALVADPARVRLAKVRRPEAGLAYRRRARMHYERDVTAAQADEGLRLGFFAPRSRTVVDVRQCPVLRPELSEALQRVRALAEHLPEHGEVMGLSDGQQVTLALPGVRPTEAAVAAAQRLLDDRLVGIALRGGRQRAQVGRPTLAIDGGDGLVPVRASALAFSQANAAVNRAMVQHVAAVARADGLRVLELFAGAGNLSRALAKTARRVWTHDDDREATELLRAMAAAEHLPINAKHGSAPNMIARLAGGPTRYDVVVVDPPRRGLGEAMAGHVATVAERRVIYVSCDPATLARDLRVMVEAGLRLTDVTVFDMMPMTAQVEVVVALERPEPPHGWDFAGVDPKAVR